MYECRVLTASGLKSGRARDMRGPQGPKSGRAVARPAQ
jgi:hypothetical protein